MLLQLARGREEKERGSKSDEEALVANDDDYEDSTEQRCVSIIMYLQHNKISQSNDIHNTQG